MTSFNNVLDTQYIFGNTSIIEFHGIIDITLKISGILCLIFLPCIKVKVFFFPQLLSRIDTQLTFLLPKRYNQFHFISIVNVNLEENLIHTKLSYDIIMIIWVLLFAWYRKSCYQLNMFSHIIKPYLSETVYTCKILFYNHDHSNQPLEFK